MQNDLETNHPDLQIQILGINERGHESGNASATDGKDLPFLQDDLLSDVWESWDVTYRDVIVVDAELEIVDVYNLTLNNLSDPDSYDDLKQILIEAATPEPVSGDCNQDGDVNASDLACVSHVQQRDVVLDALNTLPGDLDGNGEVAFADFLVLSMNFGKNLTSYRAGNINLQGGIDFEDFLVLSGNYGKTSMAAADLGEASDASSTDAVFGEWDG